MVSWKAPAVSDASMSTDPSSPSPPSSPKVVNFGGVTGVSREVSNKEHWALYGFETHCNECSVCESPYQRYKGGKRLCRDGERLGRDVSELLYRRDGQIRSCSKDDGKTVRIEMPAGYERSVELLKAIERSARHRMAFLPAERKSPSRSPRSAPPVLPEPRVPATISARGNPQPGMLKRSYSTNAASRPSLSSFYPPPPEFALPIRQAPRDHPADARDWAFGNSSRGMSTLVPVRTAPEPRMSRHSPEAPMARGYSSKRGSLYGEDMLRQKERERRESRIGMGGYAFDLEVREPTTTSSSSRHRQSQLQPSLMTSTAPLTHPGQRRRHARPVSGFFF